MAGNNKITLRLDRSRTARAFDDIESLWKPEIRKIGYLLKVHLDAVKVARDAGERQPELAISIFGTYGAGKTSLLRTLEHQTNGSKGLTYEHGSEKGDLKSRVHALPLIKPSIDPTGNHHFLYAFLATALETDRQRDPTEEVKSPRQFSARLLTEVQQAFQDVSEYLQVLDKPEEDKEYDPLGASLDRLERHTSDLHLRAKLNLFIDRLADTLATTKDGIILMPVDDADMSKESLVATLESYRRYLMHPRLIPVFTFTGRMAEELVYGDFQQRLTVEDREPGGRRRKEAARRNKSLTVPEQLALQYLAKLFPVRTRIRLGPARGRVLKASYRRHEEHSNGNGSNVVTEGSSAGRNEEKVFDLLEHSSRLLFGCPDWPEAPKVQLALRPFSLRRQFQVLDSLYAARAGALKQVWCSMPGPADDLQGENAGGNNAGSQTAGVAETWTTTFDRATWALLNAHRDVLREVNLFLDDLYGMSPKRLRKEVLGRILDLHVDTRRKILNRWIHRTEDRRSQILSLLAANAFRPQVIYNPEDEWGDKPGKQIDPREAFMAAKSCRWILNLAIGFYLPQILARNQHHDVGGSTARIRGTRWNLQSGPTQAMREFLAQGGNHANGMMRLDPRAFKSSFEESKSGAKRFLEIWCYYGYLGDRPWAAVSLWRGLSLLGRLLRIAEQHPKVAGAEEGVVRQSIRRVLVKHKQAAHVLTYDHLPESRPGDQVLLRFQPTRVKDEDEELVDALFDWLKFMRKKSLQRPANSDQGTVSEESADSKEVKDWKSCFIRRVHGDDLLGELWGKLEMKQFDLTSEKRENLQTSGTRPKENAVRENMYQALKIWVREFAEYLPKRSLVKSLVVSCPFVRPLFLEAETVETVETGETGETEKSRNRFEKILKDIGLWEDVDALGSSDLFPDLYGSLQQLERIAGSES